MMHGKKRKRSRQVLLPFLARQYKNIIIVILYSASIFFFIGAQGKRSVSKASNPDLIADGDIVNILEVVDGDELLIGDGQGGTTLLRVLGIRSFDPTVSDPLLSEYGKICFRYLKSTVVGKSAQIKVADKRLDDKGRLLGTLFLPDAEGQYTLDLAVDLLKNGYTLVYTRYDFPDMNNYLAVQEKAKAAKAGFWGDEDIASRATALLLQWDEERRND